MLAEIQSDLIHSKALPDLIAKLLAERQEILVLFNRLAAMRPYQEAVRVQFLLQQFCQIVVDYMALGHFEVYQCLEDNVRGMQHCRRVKRLARELYPRIAGTTQAAIDFSDRYAERRQALDRLDTDLSRMGEQLAARIDLEDRLITALRSPTQSGCLVTPQPQGSQPQPASAGQCQGRQQPLLILGQGSGQR